MELLICIDEDIIKEMVIEINWVLFVFVFVVEMFRYIMFE